VEGPMNRLCCSALTLSLSSAALAGEAPVQICLGEGNEWPPYTYWERQDGKINQSRLTGAATTMVLDALQQLGLQHRIQYLPWARVQQELAEFASNNRCELTWDASYKPERAAYAHYSVPLYQTHLGLFYSARRFNQPPSTPAALPAKRFCGVIGYNYAPYGVVKEPQRFPGIQQVLDMLERERCEFFPSEIEPLTSGIALGIYQGHAELRSLRLDIRKNFYLLVSKGSPRGEQLVNQLNQIFIASQESGQHAELLQRFTPTP
jgi:polar amino acid transport system substrate-binding protein